ncbi:PhoX family protein [Georgenia sp. SUBG003]|uniref:PhoX family protein n=1 Tax=Georgenia sp. SUBG003 TaxID=1497974 RepID=UPI000ADA4833
MAPSTADTVVVPGGYLQQVVVRWGDPLFSDAPPFDPDNQTAAAQERQFGYNNDFLGLLPLGGDDHLMCVNHEYVTEEMMLPGYDPENPTREQVEVSWAAHGLSVVAVTGRAYGSRSGALDVVVDHPLNRRFVTATPFALSGPVAGSDLVRTNADPKGRTVLGTLNNCAGGLTPWGTWLSGEENIDQYFANAAALAGPDPVTYRRLRRYGVEDGATGRKWERFDDRFDVAKEPNEVHRFGWIVEVDPYDATSTPRKRTALGRFKHEGANVILAPGRRAVAYMGDDERFEYLYKFVSRDAMRQGDDAHNANLLDNGTLYVAVLTGDSPEEITGDGTLPVDGEFDGAGRWVPLVTSADGVATSHVEGMSGEEALVFTREAADAVGATKMDRPEDVEPSPRTGVMYAALTNNTARTPAQTDEANPRAFNKFGQILELVDARNDNTSTTFAWRLMLVCGDPADPSTYFAGFDKSQVSPISCPDNLAFDRYGNLWISTDGAGSSIGSNDALHGVAVDGRRRGQVKQFLTVPAGAETCGPLVTDERVMVCVQHPGELDGASFENRLSHWPDGGGSLPRPAVVAVWRADGRKIGHA